MYHANMPSMGKVLSMLVIGWVLLTVGASAQRWQVVHGGGAVETGRGGVKPLAANNGYISVGSTNSFGADFDVYVVKTNLNGGIIWAFAYNFGGKDLGYDIQETAGGDFIITGSTDAPGNIDIFLLRINPAGVVVSARTFGGVNEDVGYNVLQTFNGDYVVAGWSYTTPANRDGVVLRVTPALAPVFINTYGADADEYLHGLYQAANSDLLVCGATTSFGMMSQGWIMRLAPGNGAVNWSRHVGGANGDEVLHAVIQLAVGAQAGNIVAVGSTTDPMVAPMDYYACKLTGGGVAIADLVGGSAANIDEMFDVKELQVINPGNLIMAGRTANPAGFGQQDGYAVELAPAWVCPAVKVWSMLYGGVGDDLLFSVAEDDVNCIPGLIFCGQTASQDLIGNDPQQHYLIKTTGAGVSGCHELPPPDGCGQPNFPVQNAPMNPVARPVGPFWNVGRVNAPGTNVLCFTGCPVRAPRNPGEGNDGAVEPDELSLSGVPGGEAGAGMASAYPNPIVGGETFHVAYTALRRGEKVEVMVSDAAGRILFQRAAEAADGEGAIAISTEGWAAGTYLVKVDLGDATETRKIVVLN